MQIHPSCPTCIMLGPRGSRSVVAVGEAHLAKVHPRPPCGATPTCVGVGPTPADICESAPCAHASLAAFSPPASAASPQLVVVPKEAAPLAAAASVSRRSAARAARVRCRRRQTAAQQRRWRARWRGGRAAPPCEHSAAENSMQQRFEGRGYRRLARDARQAATQLDVLNEPHREAVASGLLRELWSGRHMTPTPATGFGRVGVLLYTLRSAATIQCLGVARQAA